MTADDTPAVPDTEAEREALAWFRATPHVLEAKWLGTEPFPRHAATIVRVALARDVPAPADEPVAQMLSVLRRERDRYDRDDNDIERHEHDLIEDLIWKCEHAVSDRAGTAPTDQPPAGLPATLASVDDVAAVCLAHGLTETDGRRDDQRERAWDDGTVTATDRGGLLWVTVRGPGTEWIATVRYRQPSAVLVAAIQAARSAS